MERLERLYWEMAAFNRGDAGRIQHFIKVHSLARIIGLAEGLSEEELYILETAALTHDIGIRPAIEAEGSSCGKLQEKYGPPEVEKMLARLGFDETIVKRVSALVGRHHTYENIDGADCQILIEADFLVNLFEDGSSREAALFAKEKIFKTNAGRQLLDTMFGL